MSLVSLVGVDKSYGTWPVLQGVDLVVPDAARIGIIGPNGAGSPTSLRILGDMEDVNGGEVVRRRGVTVSYLEQNLEGTTGPPRRGARRPADIAALDDELRSIEAESRGRTSRGPREDGPACSPASRRPSIDGSRPVAPVSPARPRASIRLGFDEHDMTLPTTALSGGSASSPRSPPV